MEDERKCYEPSYYDQCIFKLDEKTKELIYLLTDVAKCSIFLGEEVTASNIINNLGSLVSDLRIARANLKMVRDTAKRRKKDV